MARHRDEQTKLHFAARQSDADSAQVLLDQDIPSFVNAEVQETGKTALLNACDVGNHDAARLLLGHDADAHATTVYGTTTLMMACMRNNVDSRRLLLLTAGVDLEARDDRGLTALHRAVNYGSIEVLRELILNHNVNLSAVDEDGNTPFDFLRRQTWPPGAKVEQFLDICGKKLTQEHGRLALHVIFDAAEYSIVPLNEVRPPLNPNRV